MATPPLINSTSDHYSLRPPSGVQPAVPIPWTWWRALLAVIAITLGIWVLLPSIEGARNAIAGWLGPEHRVPSAPSRVDEHAYLGWMLETTSVAVLIVILLALVAGRQAVGLHRRAPGEQARATGYAFHVCFGVALLGVVIQGLILWFFPAVTEGTGSAIGSEWSIGLILLRATVHAVITEEVVQTVLLYLLLEQIRTRSGTPVAHTWIGTAVIVGLWTFLHAHLGLGVLGMALGFWIKVVLWRHTRSLPALLCFHAAWNLHWILRDDLIPAIAVSTTMQVILTPVPTLAILLLGEALRRLAHHRIGDRVDEVGGTR